MRSLLIVALATRGRQNACVLNPTRCHRFLSSNSSPHMVEICEKLLSYYPHGVLHRMKSLSPEESEPLSAMFTFSRTVTGYSAWPD
jgi:hypothetical protein